KSELESANAMTCHEHYVQNETNDESKEYDEESMVLDHLTEDLKQFKDKEKFNFDETNVVNLRDDNQIKETKISVHMT
ncbi:hypothetical protein HAX54_051341, partial [Datura stramonium]|nr:hypothetical protein [Datura stramonium]